MSAWLRHWRRLLAARHAERGWRDPDGLLEQRMEELAAHQAEARAALATCRERERRLASRIAEADQLADTMLARARHALRAHREDLAREALSRHVQAHGQAEHYRQLWRRQHDDTARLQSALGALEAREAELAQYRAGFQVRRHCARVERLLAETVPGQTPGDPMLVQAEEQLQQEEWTAEAYRALMDEHLPLDAPEARTLSQEIDRVLDDLRAGLKE